MTRLFASIWKEFLLLRRDRAGLLVLFLMPAILVIVISLVQENVARTILDIRTRVIVVDQDGGALAQTIEKQLEGSGALEVVKVLNSKEAEESSALEAVRIGQCQACILIPQGFSSSVGARAHQIVQASFSRKPSPQAASLPRVVIAVYFDPAVQGAFRASVLGEVERTVLITEAREKASALAELLPSEIKRGIEQTLGVSLPNGIASSLPSIDPACESTPLIRITELLAAKDHPHPLPTSVQQNVPAWSLFGMFFIVVPLSGSLITERRNGTLTRLLSMPGSYLPLLMGKVIAYSLICMVQFALILLIGKLLLPILGTPRLDIGSHPLAVVIVAFTASLAATGFGIMVGTVAKTFEQASAIGPVSVVVAAALGGIMVPSYAMPAPMRELSVVSPLAWGLNAFHALFVRGQGLSGTLPDLLLLSAFFLLSTLFSWYILIRSRPNSA